MSEAPSNSPSANRVVLVTAGAAGIGSVIARRFLARGDSVHVCDIDAARLEQFIDANPGARGSLADVADPEQVDQLFDELATRHGRLDVLVNNAGVSGPVARCEDIDPAEWRRTIDVDLNGAFYVTRRAIPLLRAARAGCIVNIASTAGLHGCPMRTPYVAAKWAMIGLTKTLAMELGPAGIRVNAICPGSVEGERIDRVIAADARERGLPTAEIREQYLRQTSLRRFATADEVAELALYLASDAGRSISGQALAVDGHTESLSHSMETTISQESTQ